MMLTQIREEVKNAALAGLMDAWAELQAGEPNHAAAAEALRGLSASRQLPAPQGGLDLAAEAREAGIELPASNGRKRK